MKIQNNNVAGGLKNVAGNTGSSSLDKLKSDSSSSSNQLESLGSAKVNLSEKAQSMQKAQEIAMNTESVDEAKVARLQKMIDDGTYKVDASAVADRLVDEHLMFPDN